MTNLTRFAARLFGYCGRRAGTAVCMERNGHGGYHRGKAGRWPVVW